MGNQGRRKGRLAIPDGITHERIRQKGRLVVYPLSVLISMIISPLSMKFGGETLIGLGIVLGYEMGRYVTPDADIMGTTSSEGWLVNEIPVLGHFVFGILSTYGSIARRHHRSWMTHFPVVSTFPRYMLLFWWIWLEIYRSNYDLAWAIFIFIGMFIGTSMADGIHWWLDLAHSD